MTTPAPTDDGRIDVRLDDRGVAFLTIDRPSRANALGTKLLRQFLHHMHSLQADPALRAVVIAGAGPRAFIGGADIHEMAALDAAGARAFITLLHEACAAPRALAVPVIARIHGACLGGGLELAAACDIRLAGASARFAMPEVQIGLPSVIEAVLLPRLIGHARTAHLLLTGDTLDAATAAAWGLVSEAMPDPALDAAVERLLGLILSAGPQAVAAQKRLLRNWETQAPDDAVAASIEAFANSWASGEPTRMMRAALARLAARKT